MAEAGAALAAARARTAIKVVKSLREVVMGETTHTRPETCGSAYIAAMDVALLDTRQDEVRALTVRAFQELGEAVGGIGGMHGAIADRAFGLSGPGASPARVVHDAISSSVYGGIRAGARGVGKAAGVVLSQRPPGGRPVSTTERGAL